MTAEMLARTGPLQHFAERFAGLPETVQVVAEPFTAMVDLQLDPGGPAAADIARHLGVDLPTAPSTWVETDTVRVIWLGPDERLVTSPFTTPQELGAGGCSIDLHPRVLRRGAAVQTTLGRAAVVLLALDDTGTGYHILVRSSFAPYLAEWLLDAAVEHRA